MKTLGYYNGTVDELDRISVPMLDRACYFGDGVYDVTYSRNYRIFALDEHIDRFFASARLIRIEPSFGKQELRDLLLSLVKRMDSGDLWVYFQISRSADIRTHAFPTDPKPNLWIMLKEGKIRNTYAPMRCITVEDTRFAHCNVKSLNLLPNVLATQAAEEANADEAVLTRGETVTECAHSNLSILKNGTLITHPANERIYAGTGRAHLIEKCRQFGIPVEERTYTLEELKAADEALVTSASALCVPMLSLDGVAIGGKDPKAVKRLQDALLADYLKETE